MPNTVTEAAYDGVRLLISTFDHSGLKSRNLDAIKTLASMPGGVTKARDALLLFANKYVDYILWRREVDEEPPKYKFYNRGITTCYFSDVDTLFAREVLGRKWKALAIEAGRQSSRWKAAKVQKMLRRINRRFDTEFNKTPDLFARSEELLRRCKRRQVAGMLAFRAVGHLLPPELVEMVQEEMHSAENIKVYIATM